MSAQDKDAEQARYGGLCSCRKHFDQFRNGNDGRLVREARTGKDGTMALDIGCVTGNQPLFLMGGGFWFVFADLTMGTVNVTRDYLGERPGKG